MGMPKPEQQSDLDVMLIDAIRQGDADALNELILRHDRLVRGVVYGVLGQADELDDVVQKVWLTVWRRVETLDDSRRWKSWLYRMSRNAALDAGRKKQRRKGLWDKLKTMAAGGDAAGQNGQVEGTSQHVSGTTGQSYGQDPYRVAMMKEEHEIALRAIEGILAIYREPFVMRHLDGLTYQEIAERLELPVDTVGTRLVRARRMLNCLLYTSPSPRD